MPVDFGDGPTEVQVSHLFVDPSISTNLRNSYLLTAHGRLVGDPISIEQKYSLRELPDGKAYVAVVSSDFLDERVDQERLGFRMTTEQRELLDRAVMAAAEGFLRNHIGQLRRHQRATVESLLYEHPQLATQITNIDEYVEHLAPGMSDEQIAQNLFVLLYRDEKDLQKRIDRLDSLASLDDESRSQAEITLKELQNQEKHRLAELVVKRHQVLQLANMLLGYKDDERQDYHYEKVIHDLICPMGKIYKHGDGSDHNLWIIDESLANYEFFASDKSIKSLSEDAASRKEPDLIFFNPLGFRRVGTNDPVVVVEFKRPGDDRLSQDPVRQTLTYIEELRESRVRDYGGQVVSDIDEHTPFEVLIVCDLTPATRKLLSQSLAQTELRTERVIMVGRDHTMRTSESCRSRRC